MRRSSFSRLLLPWAVCLPLLASCGDKPNADSKAEIEEGPSQKFDRVVDRLKRQYQGSDAELTMHDKDGTVQRFQVRNVVNNITPQLHEPATPEGKYTAEIVIRTSTYLTLISAHRDAPETDEENAETATPSDPLKPAPLPGETPKTRKGTSTDVTEELLSKATQDQVVACDLEYEGGRWALKTRNLPESLQLAFEYALQQPGDDLNLNYRARFERDRAGELGYPEKNFGDEYLDPEKTPEK